MSFEFVLSDENTLESKISLDEIINLRISEKPTPWYTKPDHKDEGATDVCDETGLSLTQTLALRADPIWETAVNGRDDLSEAVKAKLLKIRKPSKPVKTPEERVAKALKPLGELVGSLTPENSEFYATIIEEAVTTTTEPLKSLIETAKKERIEREKRQAEAAAAKAQLDALIDANPELAALRAKIEAADVS